MVAKGPEFQLILPYTLLQRKKTIARMLASKDDCHLWTGTEIYQASYSFKKMWKAVYVEFIRLFYVDLK